MKKSGKIKLLIIGAIALLVLLLVITIAQFVTIHKREREIDNLNQQLEQLVDQVAGANPVSIQLDSENIYLN